MGDVSRLLQSITTAGAEGTVTLDQIREFVRLTSGVPGETQLWIREDGGHQKWSRPALIRVTHTIEDD